MTWLLVRRYRLPLLCWTALVTALCSTPSAYQSAYATAEQRRTAVVLAQNNPASTLVYGRLPDPGTAAQMFAWEIGAFVTILTAIMAVVVAVTLTRTAEDDGSLELLRGCGVPPMRPLHSALVILAVQSGVLAVACTGAVLATSRTADGVTGAGAAAFGAVVGLTFATVAAVTVLLAQVAATAGQARLLGFTALGAAFAARAIADTRHLGTLNRLSPLGLRAVTGPFTEDRWGALLPGLLAVVILGGTAVLLCARREFGAGLLPRRDRRGGRLRIRTTVGLAARLARPALLSWTVAVAAIGTLFAAMGSGTVEQQRDGEVGGFLGSQLGAGDPAAEYLAYCGTVVGIVVSTYAILSILAGLRAEDTGRTGLVLVTGVRRWAPTAAQAVVTAAGCLVVLTITGVISALITPSVLDGDDIGPRSLAYTVGQWPAAMASIGCATLLVGAFPRLSGLAWLPLLASSGLALLGELLGVPRRIQDLGFFRHVPDVAGPDPHVTPLLVLIAAGAVLVLLGAAGSTRRDLRAG
ncbi:ABC transporter permease [Actinoplanes palleronii]